MAEWLFAQPVIFSWYAALIAAIVVSFPLVYQAVNAGIASVPVELKHAAQLDGANDWEILLKIILPLAAPFIRNAYVLAFARSLGEIGATLMVAGNIPGKTQTISTAIFAAVESNQLVHAWILSLVVVIVSFVLLRNI
ncbi:Molybdenum transport system permease protein ModB [compost metagenome]